MIFIDTYIYIYIYMHISIIISIQKRHDHLMVKWLIMKIATPNYYNI